MAIPGEHRQSIDKEIAETSPQSDTAIGRDAFTGDATIANTHVIENDRPIRRGSTGPRTERGKRRASGNSLKHGIFSKATELPAEFALAQVLRREFQKAQRPIGMLEELEVDNLVSISLRRCRLRTAESAEGRKASELFEADMRQLQREEAQAICERVLPDVGADLSLVPGGLISRVDNPEILKRCLDILNVLREQIQANGFDTEKDNFLLAKLYGDSRRPQLPRPLQNIYWLWALRALDANEKTSEEFDADEQCASSEEREVSAEYEECKNKALEEIQVEMTWLEQYRNKFQLIEAKKIKFEVLVRGIPNAQAMDRFNRLEVHLDRSEDRALARLENMQRRRRGEPTPARISVDLSR